MKKIAIIGASKHDRIFLAQTLSYLTGYEIIRQTAYPIQAIKYGFNRELTKCNWRELFLYLFSSFSERIEVEQKCEHYISNGSVFNELANMEAIVDLSVCSKREKKEQKYIIAGMRKIITEYANKEYDCIIHKFINPQNSSNLSVNIDIILDELSINCEKVYHINEESVLTDILEIIITNPKISPRLALEKAKKDIYK